MQAASLLQARGGAAEAATEPSEEEDVQGDGEDIPENWDVMGFVVLETLARHKIFLATHSATSLVADEEIEQTHDKNTDRQGDEPRWHP